MASRFRSSVTLTLPKTHWKHNLVANITKLTLENSLFNPLLSRFPRYGVWYGFEKEERSGVRNAKDRRELGHSANSMHMFESLHDLQQSFSMPMSVSVTPSLF